MTTQQHNNQRRIPCFTLLWLAAAAFSLMMSTQTSPVVSAFAPSSTIVRNGRTVLRADVAPSADAAPTPAASGEHPKQSEYGKSLELPETYASCGQCGATYALTLEAMGPGKGGRRMECSVCSHTWFQSRERIASLGEGFEMVPLPDRDMERIQLNIKENRHPKYCGDFKMYVGNISWQSTEEDLFEIFETIGPVGEAIMVYDNTGKSRGFGFVTMRNKEDGEKAIVELDGADLKGRNLNVRPSNN
mmetsp:Transcript_8970/g.19380  ORF Transcript_8970/g.19380 Transcript_8970/m.19380 type:complete len:246 (-) Transcript_8970:166-903(-)|eukprot:CAMPEP_0168191858 /NCGR_PEP_ID=MMETSP0139_2-20121125/17740_1 /TAXON_ID=44445 /ORGANISM="Pseudo-nitzschia australis, Strain 10249 10 AB" /LENGTH=245 /DNA_ID=CAMNT_0008115061 /DNA_START=167 /DNA_END=904 /DNA_ORIENTATION=-